MSLMSDLNALKLAHHVEEDNNWYSCPKSGQCSRENVDACDCGANKHNTKVSLLQARLAPIREVWENTTRMTEEPFIQIETPAHDEAERYIKDRAMETQP